MLLIGLTGSIATGKSTVSAILAAPPYSLPIIDADKLARQVVEPGTPAYDAIVSYFGPTTPDLLLPAEEGGVVDASSSTTTSITKRPLNRPALGRRVFGTTESRARDRTVLNSIVHPAVRSAMYRALLSHYLRGCRVVVLDVPLLFEAGLDALCGTVLVVGVRDRAVQLTRLRARDPHLGEEEAAARVASQRDVRDKAAQAAARGECRARGVVVWNDGDREQLQREVEAAMTHVEGSSPRWWAWLLLGCPPLAMAVAVWNLFLNVQARRNWEQRERARL